MTRVSLSECLIPYPQLLRLSGWGFRRGTLALAVVLKIAELGTVRVHLVEFQLATVEHLVQERA